MVFQPLGTERMLKLTVFQVAMLTNTKCKYPLEYRRFKYQMYFYLNLASYLKHNLRMSGSTGVMESERGFTINKNVPRIGTLRPHSGTNFLL